MQTFSPELVETMRAALEEAMSRLPSEQAIPRIKAILAECILKAATEGQTSHDSLVSALAEQLPAILNVHLMQ